VLAFCSQGVGGRDQFFNGCGCCFFEIFLNGYLCGGCFFSSTAKALGELLLVHTIFGFPTWSLFVEEKRKERFLGVLLLFYHFNKLLFLWGCGMFFYLPT